MFGGKHSSGILEKPTVDKLLFTRLSIVTTDYKLQSQEENKVTRQIIW